MSMPRMIASTMSSMHSARRSRLRLLLPALLLSLLLLSIAPPALAKRGHPKEHHHGDGHKSHNSTFYLSFTRHHPPHRLTPSPTTTTSLSSFSTTHDHLSSHLPRIASTAPLSNGPPRSFHVDPSHFHTLLPSSSPSPPSTPEPEPSIVNLTDSYHVMYTATLTIGTPPQPFHMILDTGSSCLWAVSSQPSHTGHHLPPFLHPYDHSLSSTYVPDGTPWSISYGVGQCEGFLSRDTVRLSPYLAVTNQSLGEAVELSANFLNPQQPLDGIVGMSFAGGACQGEETLIEGLYREGRIGRRVFSFHLDRGEGAEEVNEVAIGEEEVGGEGEHIVYTDVLHAPHRAPAMWFVHLEALSIVYAKGTSPLGNHTDDKAEGPPPSRSDSPRGSHTSHSSHTPSSKTDDNEEEDDVLRVRERREASRRLRSFIAAHQADTPVASAASDSISFCGPQTGPCIALPDTGTSFLTLPTRLFILLISIITHGRDDCIIDSLSNVFCLDKPHTLPSLTFTFHSHTFTLTPHDYILPNKQLAIQVLDFGIEDVHIVILGDVFLRKVRVVFDQEEWRVGFVQVKGEEGGEGGEGQWMDGEGELGEGTGGLWVALVMLGLMLTVCLVCGCVCYDWCVRRKRRGEYQPISASAA